MKTFILLKEGNYVVNAFADVMEAFNNDSSSNDFSETLQYYTTSSVALHLHRNQSDSAGQLALAHFMVDPKYPPNDINHFRPIHDMLMREAADVHGLVLFGMITTEETIHDNRLLSEGIYIVRDADGHLINYETKERLLSDDQHINTVTFFGLSKIENLPVYYLITDPHVVKVGNGFDFVDEENNVEFRQITDHDGTLRESLFTPTVEAPNKLINDTIFVTSSELEISLFNHPYNLFKSNNITDVLDDINMDVTSNFKVDVTNNKIQVNVDSNIGYVTIKLNLGHFCDMAYQERPEFNFIIHKI